MMIQYHIGSLDEASRRILQDPAETTPSESNTPRPTFLQSKQWTKAILSSKKSISSDTRIFSFTLEHAEQTIGLPIGKHLMMRLRDPVTREAIIRSYTPISEGSSKGVLDILIKIYLDTKDAPGGKMTKALDSIPVGHFVDFKGPTGHFEYHSRGRCTISGKERHVKKFIMICAGSGVTPIFQVLRAVLSDKEDETECLVLDGNRLEEDILCKKVMDRLLIGNEHRCKLLYSLTKPGDDWTGLKGRLSRELLEQEVGSCKVKNGEELVLICGPGALEKSVHSILNEMGWGDEHLLFF
jgi:nitrate reductase (NAD(P)H)